MSEYQDKAGLQVGRQLAAFVDDEVLAPLGKEAAAFWSGFARLLDRFVPQNRALLAKRDDLQRQMNPLSVDVIGHRPGATRRICALDPRDDAPGGLDEMLWESSRSMAYGPPLWES